MVEEQKSVTSANVTDVTDPGEPRRRKGWRWRRCPGCERVFAAGDLVILGTYPLGAAWTDGTVARACPRCGYAGYTRDFLVVRERHGEVVATAPVRLPPLPVYACRRCGTAMSAARVAETCGGLLPCAPAGSPLRQYIVARYGAMVTPPGSAPLPILIPEAA